MIKLLKKVFNKKVDVNSVEVKKVINYDDIVDQHTCDICDIIYYQEGGR